MHATRGHFVESGDHYLERGQVSCVCVFMFFHCLNPLDWLRNRGPFREIGDPSNSLLFHFARKHILCQVCAKNQRRIVPEKNSWRA